MQFAFISVSETNKRHGREQELISYILVYIESVTVALYGAHYPVGPRLHVMLAHNAHQL